MFIEAVIGSFVGAAFACPNVARTLETSTNTITTKLSDISDKVDGMNNTLLAMKSKISEIEIEQSRMFHAFQWHDVVQTLMAKNAVYIGNNILELKENDSVIQLNLVERSITETKFGKTYEKKFDGSEYIDGKCFHSKDTTCEKWFDLEGKCIHEVDSDGKETWYEYDKSNRCVHKKVEHGKDYEELWWEFDSDGKLIRRRIKQKLIGDGWFYGNPTTYEYANEDVLKKGFKYLSERLVEYGNVIHLVSKKDDDTVEECYCTKDLVEPHLIGEFLLGHRYRYSARKYYEIYKLRDIIGYNNGLIYYRNEFCECGGNITHFYNDDYNDDNEWHDANGKIEKEFFNFLTHTYEKRLAIAKHKLEEAKSIITNSI